MNVNKTLFPKTGYVVVGDLSEIIDDLSGLWGEMVEQSQYFEKGKMYFHDYDTGIEYLNGVIKPIGIGEGTIEDDSGNVYKINTGTFGVVVLEFFEHIKTNDDIKFNSTQEIIDFIERNYPFLNIIKCNPFDNLEKPYCLVSYDDESKIFQINSIIITTDVVVEIEE